MTAADPAASPRVLKHDGRSTHVAFAPDGKPLASASEDETVRLWDLTAPDPAASPASSARRLGQHVAFAPDGKVARLRL